VLSYSLFRQKLKGDAKMTTISDIAREAGVSKTTVSRVLNGSFHQVTNETKERVQSIIKRFDYTPNSLAKGLKSMKTNVIGIVLSDLQNPFWAAVLDGVERTCGSLGYNIMICNACKDWLIEEQHVKKLRDRKVDGIIINPTARNHAFFTSLIADNYPFVALNRKMEGLSVETVAVDNVKGAFLATEHLIHLGNKKISLIVYPPEGISPRLERIEGYIQAHNRNGIDVMESHIHIIEDKKNNAKWVTKQILSGEDRPDAIFSTNNLMSLEILEAIKELGLKIPEDISLVGYDETVWSRHVDPPLTIVKQPAYEMGEVAANSLIHLIRSKNKINDGKTHLLDPVLIVRNSCGSNNKKNGFSE
jgi:DNA-binding LacI/PurR family transcriptional regulator